MRDLMADLMIWFAIKICRFYECNVSIRQLSLISPLPPHLPAQISNPQIFAEYLLHVSDLSNDISNILLGNSFFFLFTPFQFLYATE